MKKSEIIEQLELLGVDFDPADQKVVLEALLEESKNSSSEPAVDVVADGEGVSVEVVPEPDAIEAMFPEDKKEVMKQLRKLGVGFSLDTSLEDLELLLTMALDKPKDLEELLEDDQVAVELVDGRKMVGKRKVINDRNHVEVVEGDGSTYLYHRLEDGRYGI